MTSGKIFPHWFLLAFIFPVLAQNQPMPTLFCPNSSISVINRSFSEGNEFLFFLSTIVIFYFIEFH
jgi:hypothetical protein